MEADKTTDNIGLESPSRRNLLPDPSYFTALLSRKNIHTTERWGPGDLKPGIVELIWLRGPHERKDSSCNFAGWLGALNNSEKLGTNSIQQQSIFDIIVNLFPFTSPGNLKFSTAAGLNSTHPPGMSQIPSFVLGADVQRSSDFLPFSPYEVVPVVFWEGIVQKIKDSGARMCGWWSGRGTWCTW